MRPQLAFQQRVLAPDIVPQACGRAWLPPPEHAGV